MAWRIARPRPDVKRMQLTAREKLLKASRLRVWGARTVLSLLDQGVTSGASFVTNLLLARVVAPSLYRAFALMFAGFLLVTGFHNVIFLEPMTVYGASRYREEVSKYFAANLRAHMVVMGALSAGVSILGGVSGRRSLFGARVHFLA